MTLEPLEPREVPAGLYDPAVYNGQPAFPDAPDEWGIGVRLPDGGLRIATRDGVVHPYPTFG